FAVEKQSRIAELAVGAGHQAVCGTRRFPVSRLSRLWRLPGCGPTGKTRGLVLVASIVFSSHALRSCSYQAIASTPANRNSILYVKTPEEMFVGHNISKVKEL